MNHLEYERSDFFREKKSYCYKKKWRLNKLKKKRLYRKLHKKIDLFESKELNKKFSMCFKIINKNNY